MPQKKNDHVCVFPNIDYHAKFDELSAQGIPPMMMSLVRDRAGWIPDMQRILTLQDLENSIRTEVARYYKHSDDDILQDVFHKIQIWGGEHGRYIYVQGPAFDWSEVGPCYRRLVRPVLEDGRTVECLARKAKAMNTAMQIQGRRLGISFITKHVHFWSAVCRGDDALPIFDRIMAQGLGVRLDWGYLPAYWEEMQEKASSLDISVDALERQLFNYFKISTK